MQNCASLAWPLQHVSVHEALQHASFSVFSFACATFFNALSYRVQAYVSSALPVQHSSMH